MNLAAYLADLVGRYTRLTCPHCPLVIRFRGVDLDEELSLRYRMDRHIKTHHNTQSEEK